METSFSEISARVTFGKNELEMRTVSASLPGSSVKTNLIEIAYREIAYRDFECLETDADSVKRGSVKRVVNVVAREYYLADDKDHRIRAFQAFAHRALNTPWKISPFADKIDSLNGHSSAPKHHGDF